MTEKYWFKAYNSGYGWYPASWQGWGTIILYIALVLHSFFQANKITHSISDLLYYFLPRLFIFTAILIVVTYIKGQSITWGSKGKQQQEIP